MPALRRRDYLFKRDGSQYWHVRFQDNGKSRAMSLKTTDRLAAEVAAQPYIAAHKQRLMARRPKLETAWVSQHAPGLHTLDDGQRIFATERELHFLDASGATVRTEPNGGLASHLVNAGPAFDGLQTALMVGVDPGEFFKERPTLATKNADDALFETYIEQNKVTGPGEREARHVWSMFKTLSDNKPLKDCTRNDGRLLVKHFTEQGLKSASIRKKIMWVRAAVNLAIKDGLLTFNPFADLVPKPKGKVDDATKRKPLDVADMKLCADNLSKLSAADQLLFRVLACTGMRLGEAYQINSELIEEGCRYVVIGTKSAQSERRVPLPAAALPFLPDKITGPLFKGKPNDASKRLNTWLDDVGITDERKVVHSLRHRAQDRLRAVECPHDVRKALLGHDDVSIGEGYGEGFPVTVLRKWIDKIGL